MIGSSAVLAASAVTLLLVSPVGAAADQPPDHPIRTLAGAEHPQKEVLTLPEAAELLRVGDSVLLKLAESGELPARKVGEHWRFSRAALMTWLAGAVGEARPAASAESKGSAAPLAPEGAAALSRSEGAALKGRGTAAQGESPQVRDEPIGEAPSQKSASEVFLRDRMVLLRPNEVTLDIGAFYGRSDDLVLAANAGTATLATVESDTFGGLVVARYSIGGDTELFASASYRDQKVSVFDGVTRIGQASRRDFGDIGLGLRRTIQHEGPGRPDVVLTAEGGIPTGSGSYSLGGGVSFVKSFDPAILYASLDYRHAFDREVRDVTNLQPKDRIDATMGYALALNDTLTLNTSLTGIFAQRTSADRFTLRGSETFNLLFGLTTRVSRTVYLQPSVSFRLNGPGNAIVFGLNVPYTFGN